MSQVNSRISRLQVGDVLLGAAVALGVVGLFDLLAWQAAAAATVVIGAVVALSVKGTRWKAVTCALCLLAAPLVGILALVGFDATLNSALKAVHSIFNDEARVPVWVGLILAVAELSAAAGWFLHRVRFSKDAAVGFAAGWAVALVIGLPLLIGLLEAGTSQVSHPGPVPSRLHILIVSDGGQHPPPAELPVTPALGELTVDYSVGVATGDGVRWTLVEGESEREALLAAAEGSGRPSAAAGPAPTGEADSVLVLLVDGTDPVVASPSELPNRPAQPGEVQRWTQVAAAAGYGPETTFALLQSTDPARLRQWKGWQGGTAVSLQALESQAVTDAAFRLAVGAAESPDDYLLALRFRPILLFDHEEQVPWPLSIRTIFREGRVRLCRDEGVRTDCPSTPTLNPDELENGSTSLRLDLPKSRELRKRARQELRRLEAEATPEVGPKAEATVPEGTPPAGSVETAPPQAEAPAPLGAGSTIYVHPVALQRKHLLYLDYWWYLPDNPVELGGGALCGAGLVIAGITCDNHQSDWEGMTVEVGTGGAEPRLVAVQYAQHDSVIRYRWQDLRRFWDESPLGAKVTGIEGFGTRPLAFIARGTHATYPVPCGDCAQLKQWALGEEPHRGDLPWVGDYSSVCGRSSCLQFLPTHARGTEPASWNAYENPWGELDCFLVYYCDSGTPPRSPGQQGRYQHPTRYTSEETLPRVAAVRRAMGPN